MQSLYDKYGGFPTVSAIVHDFYGRVLDSETLAHFFRNTDMRRLVEHQTAFFCKVLGGADNYKGRSLKEAHRGTGIDHAAFDEVVSILVDCLEDAGMADEDVRTVVGVLESVRTEVVDFDSATRSAVPAS